MKGFATGIAVMVAVIWLWWFWKTHNINVRNNGAYDPFFDGGYYGDPGIFGRGGVAFTVNTPWAAGGARF